MPFNIDTIFDAAGPLTSLRASPLIIALWATLLRRENVRYKSQFAHTPRSLINIAREEISEAIKSNRWLRYYTIWTLVRLVNLIANRVVVDRQSPRQIHWRDHVVVVSGGARGIGGRVVELLKAKGASVIVIDRASKSVHSREDLFISADVTNQDDMLSAHAKVRDEFGSTTMIVAAAGIARHAFVLDPPAVISSDFSAKVIDVNYKGTYTFVKVFAQDMLAGYDEATEAKMAQSGQLQKQGQQQIRVEGGPPRNGFGGHILLIGSGAAFIPLPGNATYNSSKAAIVSLHHTLGWELDVWHKARNVRNSVFCPLMIDSDMTQGRMLHQKNQFLFPTLNVDQAARKIIAVLESDTSQMFFAPRASYVSSTIVMNSPTWLIRLVFKALGAHNTFTDYAGKTRYEAPEH